MCARFLPAYVADDGANASFGFGYIETSTEAYIGVPVQVRPRIRPTGLAASTASKLHRSPAGKLADCKCRGARQRQLNNVFGEIHRVGRNGSSPVLSSERELPPVPYARTSHTRCSDPRETKRGASRRRWRNRLRHLDRDGHFPRSTRSDAMAACRHARRRPPHGPRVACARSDEARAAAPGYAVALSVAAHLKHIL